MSASAETAASGESAAGGGTAAGGWSWPGPAGSCDEGTLTIPMLVAGQVKEVVEDAVDHGDGHREVAGAGFQVDAGAGDVRGEPPAVRERDHVVLVALPDRRPAGGGADGESPVGG